MRCAGDAKAHAPGGPELLQNGSGGRPANGFDRTLRDLRERALLSQEGLAARAGISVRTIRYLESGRTRRPRLGSLRLLADALGLRGLCRARFEEAGARGPFSTVSLIEEPELVNIDDLIDRLRGLGLAAAVLPVDLEERVVLIRRLMASKCMFLVFDNALSPLEVQRLG